MYRPTRPDPGTVEAAEDRGSGPEKPFKSRYRVGEVPWAWRPVFWVYSIAVAFGMYFYFRLVHVTSRVSTSGLDRLDSGASYLFACWHDRFPLYLASRLRQNGQAWMVLDDWYMNPMHLLARWSGVEILIYGATGQGGRAAAEILVRELAAGRSTVFLPDGPSSRPRELRKGILHMARDSGRAIVPMKLACTRAIRLPTWDLKALPLPFGRLRLDFGRPQRVSEVDPAAIENLSRALD